MLNNDITHPKTAETDQEPPHVVRKKKDGFDNLYIDAQRFIVYGPALASVVVVTAKRRCQIRVGMPCRVFSNSADPQGLTEHSR